MKYYYDPQNRLPKIKRIRNRIIAVVIFVVACFAIGSCIANGKGMLNSNLPQSHNAEQIADTLPQAGEAPLFETTPIKKVVKPKDTTNTQNATAEPEIIEIIDSTHIKSQKNPFLAAKIDNMLRRFKPWYGMMLVVDAATNEIIAWGERKDTAVQTSPDFLVKNTFPAASLAKTVTVAAALESKRYSTNTQIPDIGEHHTLYKRQLKVPENYSGNTISLEDAYAKSTNPPLAIVGLSLGASRLSKAAKMLGYNTNFPSGIPGRSSYEVPDSSFGIAEVSCGFTDATTLTPLLAAAQVRSILLGKPLEIPWAANLSPYAPNKPLALNVEKFSANTYYGLRKAMLQARENGTATKQLSTANMAKKNFEALNLGGKTGSLDGKDPQGRYDWFMGFAESKENPKKAIIVVVMQVHNLQVARSQPATQVAALIMNYWAHQNLWN